MFLTRDPSFPTYDRYDEQQARGLFLMVFGNSDADKAGKPDYESDKSKGGWLRVLVRKVTFKQLGHFMMGHCKINLGKGETIEVSLSGAYGSDGLPIEVTMLREYVKVGNDVQPRGASDKGRKLWERLHPLPIELVKAFWEGGGHNSAGSEGPQLREWARSNIERLQKLRARVEE